jgi:DUF1365 family protein
VRSALYRGTLVHSRRTPGSNAFRYPISSFVLDLDELPDLRALGHDNHFVRGWDFYLACCDAGFRTRARRDAQLVVER